MASTSITVSALQRVMLQDKTYAIILPINTTDEVFVDIGTNRNLTQALSDININITSNLDSVVDDMLNLISQLTSSALIQKPLVMNHVFADDLATRNSFTLKSGVFESGSIFI